MKTAAALPPTPAQEPKGHHKREASTEVPGGSEKEKDGTGDKRRKPKERLKLLEQLQHHQDQAQKHQGGGGICTANEETTSRLEHMCFGAKRIHTYGRRNRLCHNQVKRMADIGDWPGLARRILHDLDTLPGVMSFDSGCLEVERSLKPSIGSGALRLQQQRW